MTVVTGLGVILAILSSSSLPPAGVVFASITITPLSPTITPLFPPPPSIQYTFGFNWCGVKGAGAGACPNASVAVKITAAISVEEKPSRNSIDYSPSRNSITLRAHSRAGYGSRFEAFGTAHAPGLDPIDCCAETRSPFLGCRHRQLAIELGQLALLQMQL